MLATRLYRSVLAVVVIAALTSTSTPTEAAAQGPTPPSESQQPAPFVDVDDSSFAATEILRLRELGITTGTSATTFSPSDVVTREQMAIFLARTIEQITGESCETTASPFADVPLGSAAHDEITCIYERGITTGASPDSYQPERVVTREQMAGFLGRMIEYVTAEACPIANLPFEDVEVSSYAYDQIACIFRLGVSTGTSPRTFDPTLAVTREQMAAFLVRSYDALTAAAGTDPECCAEGTLGVTPIARSNFDKFTKGGFWEFIQTNYDYMIVYEPYWDSRVAEYDNTYVYQNSYGMSVSAPKDSRAADHPDWILRDAAGRPLYIPFRCGNGCARYAGDVGNPEFRADSIAYLRGLVDRGYTGVFLDDVNFDWRFGDSTGADVRPIDPRTGVEMTLVNWQTYLAEFLELISEEVPELKIMHNVIWYVDSPTFDNPLIDRAIRATDVVVLDRGVNDAGLVGGSGRFGLETFMAAAERIHRLGSAVMLIDEVATNGVEQEFNLAGALLLNQGHDLISTDNVDMIGPNEFWDPFHTDLGAALAKFHLDDGLFRRDFVGGLVLLNQPGNESVAIQLRTPMRTLDGTIVSAVALGPREAAVLSYV